MTTRTRSYIKANFTPLVIGVCIGLLYGITANLIESIILKIALIYAK
jgi:hypothetical protein